MKRTLAAFAALAMLTASALAAPVIGQPAPAFTGVTADGGMVDLAAYAGKTVVLEWTNNGCPYVKKHYGAGNMQQTQAAAAADGVVWLTVISSAEGKQGYATPDEAKAIAAAAKAAPAAIVLDASGEIGRAYDARTTPHMFVIDGAGTLVYAGAIDDKPTADAADIPGATNYVLAALEDVKNGRPVATPESEPYGCSVKY